jgi:hypothetical protein
MPLGSVTQGTKENFQVIITDKEGAVTELASSTPKFDVMDEGDVFKYGDGTFANAQAATASGMVITALVDTNNGGVWDEGDYRLFVWFVVGSETIRKGPFFFQVVE